MTGLHHARRYQIGRRCIETLRLPAKRRPHLARIGLIGIEIGQMHRQITGILLGIPLHEVRVECHE